MNQQSTSLVPFGPQGQLLDPLTLLFYLLTLPIRILFDVVSNIAPAAVQAAIRVPFPSLTPAEHPLSRTNVIEAPSYKILETPSVTPAAAPASSPATYENEERCEIIWNEDGLPTEIIIHRRATRT
jgi:hypothetical protein